jgi:hypothetical protein
MSGLPKKNRPEFDALHRSALIDARRRGLNFQQIAEEFNARQIPRHSNQPWSRLAVYKRWVALGRPEKKSPPETPQEMDAL